MKTPQQQKPQVKKELHINPKLLNRSSITNNRLSFSDVERLLNRKIRYSR